MKNTLFRRLELAISLLRTLSQVLDVRSRLLRSENQRQATRHCFYGSGLSMKDAAASANTHW